MTYEGMHKYCDFCNRVFTDGTYLYCPFCRQDLRLARVSIRPYYKPAKAVKGGSE